MKKLFTLFLVTVLCSITCLAAADTYQPLKETFYRYNAANDTWDEYYRAEFSVDDASHRCATSHIIPASGVDIPEALIKYTFDDRNRDTEVLTMRRDATSGSWQNYSKTEYAYDDVVPNYYKTYMNYYWNETSWVESHGQVHDIIRNDKGVVVSHVVYSGGPGQRDEPVNKTVCATSSDGSVITAIKYYERKVYIPGSALEQTYELRDIVWHTTDGQYLDLSPTSGGANGMSYAKVCSGGEEVGELTGEYTDSGESFKFANDVAQEYHEYEVTITDPLTGSYRTVTTERKLEYTDDYSDLNGDGIITEEDKILRSRASVVEYTFNEEGTILSFHNKSFRDGVMTNESQNVYEYEYDADNHVTQQTVYSRQLGESELKPDRRICFSEFYELSAGVDEVVAGPKASVSVAGRTLTVGGTAASTLTVVALDGRTVATASGEGSYSVALDGLASGVYVAAVSTGADTVTAKIILR